MKKIPELTRTNAVLAAVLRTHSERTSLIVLGTLTATLLILAYITLVIPNASYVEIYLNDVFGLTDAAYRTFMGQIPSVDFQSLYGAANYYPAALGFYLGFNAGGVFGFGHFAIAVPLLIIATLASYRRFPILQSAILILFLFLLIVAPMRVGGEYSELTYALYYTRHGWAALTIVLLFYLEPRTTRRSDMLLDSTALSLLLLYLFYNKITFAVVALAFVAINSITSRYKMRVSIISLSIFAFIAAAILIFTEYNSAYLNDITGVVNRNSALRNDYKDLLLLVSEHLWIILLCLTALTMVYLAGHRTLFDLAFVTGSILSSLAILDQSGGTAGGLPALLAVFLICGELARRTECHVDERITPSSRPAYVASISIFGMLLAFSAEPMLQAGLTLGNHFKKTTGDRPATTVNLSGFSVGQLPYGDMHEMLGHDDAAHTLFNQLVSSRESRQLNAREHLPLVAEGVKLLESVPHDNHSVITFEHTNPFSMILRMQPPRYGYPLLWANKMKLRDLPVPELYFSDTDYVMVPEVPYSRYQLVQLMKAYGMYLEENFIQIKGSPHWRLYARKSSSQLE